MSWRRLLTLLALPTGVALLAVAIARADLHTLGVVARGLGSALPLVLIPGAVWHLVRTIAWYRAFPSGAEPPFWRLFRVRLAAEAFSFVTVRGVAGEPLKVVLLEPSVPAAVSTAAVALERIAYLVVTLTIVFAAAIAVLTFLPISTAWFEVFVAVAVVSGAATAGLILLINRPLRGGQQTTRQPQSPTLAFIRAVDTQLRALVKSDSRRLVALVILQAIAFAAMCAEVLAVLWASNATPDLLGAIGIETFTRVASMISAFIPANLGALEASNVVAAGMINAAGAAAALALVRRLRGLLWCVAGFACYPPRALRKRKGDERRREGTLALYEERLAEVPITTTLGGLPIGERVVRAAVRAGYAGVVVLTQREHAPWTRIAERFRGAIDITVLADPGQWATASRGAVVMSTAVVPSPGRLERLRAALTSQPSLDEPPALTALNPLTPLTDEQIVRTLPDVAAAERRLRQSIIKPTDGRVGRFNRRMSIPISIALIRWSRCSANAMSVFLIVLGFYAGWLFSIGTYASGVAAAAFSLAASILDGCDGELARLQFKDSRFGVWLDTLGDYSYYLAIFSGLTIGAVRQTEWSGFWWIGAALITGALLTFALLILLRRRITHGQPERLRTTAQSHFEQRGTRWTALAARLSTVATRATMPYGILAFAIAGALPALVVLAAIGANVYWICLSLELGRLLGNTPHATPTAA
jgi:phosphatidylglycerophosphate synthase